MVSLGNAEHNSWPVFRIRFDDDGTDKFVRKDYGKTYMAVQAPTIEVARAQVWTYVEGSNLASEEMRLFAKGYRAGYFTLPDERPQLCTLHDVAQWAGVTDDAVTKWLNRNLEFPMAASHATAGMVWYWPMVRAWCERTGYGRVPVRKTR